MNIVSIRQKVERAINKAPLTITLMRDFKVDDGCGGYIIPEVRPDAKVATIQGILDNSSSGVSGVSSTPSPGGIVTKSNSPKFITIWQEELEIKRGDYFTLDGVKYTVTNPVNILNMNIYWELSLELNIYGRELDDA